MWIYCKIPAWEWQLRTGPTACKLPLPGKFLTPTISVPLPHQEAKVWTCGPWCHLLSSSDSTNLHDISTHEVQSRPPTLPAARSSAVPNRFVMQLLRWLNLRQAVISLQTQNLGHIMKTQAASEANRANPHSNPVVSQKGFPVRTTWTQDTKYNSTQST